MRNKTGINGMARVPQGSGVAGLFAVPTLEELAVDSGKAGVLDAHTTDVLETTAINALNALRARKLTLAAEAPTSSQTRQSDRLLTAEQVAERIQASVDWVYHKHEKLPFTVHMDGMLRFSENGLEDYIRKRRNA